MKKLFSLGLAFLTSGLCFAQDQVEMADVMRESGKIYVVIGGIITILLGVLLFLIIIDRKVGEIEKKIKKG